MNTCNNCEFWNKDDAAVKANPKIVLECRHFPPTAGVGFSKVWPRTTQDDWCGQHKPALIKVEEPVKSEEVPIPIAAAEPVKRKWGRQKK